MKERWSTSFWMYWDANERNMRIKERKKENNRPDKWYNENKKQRKLK